MDPTTLLSQLKDVHPPELISWWPLAMGWWGLIIFTLVLLTSITIYTRRWWRRNAWRRAALNELKQIAANYLTQPTIAHLITVIELLKRSVSSAQNDLRVLSATSTEWQHFLEKNLEKGRENAPATLSFEDIVILSQGHYQPETPELSAASFVRIERFIKRLGNV